LPERPQILRLLLPPPAANSHGRVLCQGWRPDRESGSRVEVAEAIRRNAAIKKTRRKAGSRSGCSARGSDRARRSVVRRCAGGPWPDEAQGAASVGRALAPLSGWRAGKVLRALADRSNAPA